MIEFFFDKLKKKDVYQYVLWVIGFVYITTIFLPQFTMKTLLGSLTTGIAFLVLFMLLVDLVLFKFDILKIKNKLKRKIPLSVFSLVISFAIGIAGLFALLGPATLYLQVEEVSDNLLHPLGNDRWQLTVAEQHQPYFTDWISYFGPKFFSIPIYLVLFMAGSVILFYLMVGRMKNKFTFSMAYLVFLLAFVLSRYSRTSTFNGTNTLSKFVYLGSLGIFMGLAAYLFFKSFYKDRETYSKILDMDKKYIFVLVWFLIMVIAARGAARLIFIFTPITAVLASFAVVWLGEFFWKIKQPWYKWLGIAVLFLMLLSPFAVPVKGMVPYFSEQSLNQAKYSGPGYNQQWQIAGKWVRENVDKDAVFGHWWDYGYWVLGGFQRAAVLDGANKIKYWNHLMGRHVLTGQSQTEALEFLKVHKTTHYLIVSDEIGKYTAYSSIGGDKNYDRYSWITTFKINPQATRETRNETVYTFQGGYMLDDDFVWNNMVYPAKSAGIGAFFLPVQQKSVTENNETRVVLDFKQPTAALINGGKRVDVPLQCIFFNGRMYKFDKPGLKGCFRLVPTLNNQGRVENPIGAGMYVSEEGMNALWVNLYVFNQKNPDYDTSAFNLTYKDTYLSDVVLFQGRIRGPIKIWEINYPSNFTVPEATKKKYLGGNELLPKWFYDV